MNCVLYKSFTTIMFWESAAGESETFAVAQELLVSVFRCVSCRRRGGEQAKGCVDRCSFLAADGAAGLTGSNVPQPTLVYCTRPVLNTLPVVRLASMPEDVTTEQHFENKRAPLIVSSKSWRCWSFLSVHHACTLASPPQ